MYCIIFLGKSIKKSENDQDEVESEAKMERLRNKIVEMSNNEVSPDRLKKQLLQTYKKTTKNENDDEEEKVKVVVKETKEEDDDDNDEEEEKDKSYR